MLWPNGPYQATQGRRIRGRGQGRGQHQFPQYNPPYQPVPQQNTMQQPPPYHINREPTIVKKFHN